MRTDKGFEEVLDAVIRVEENSSNNGLDFSWNEGIQHDSRSKEKK